MNSIPVDFMELVEVVYGDLDVWLSNISEHNLPISEFQLPKSLREKEPMDMAPKSPAKVKGNGENMFKSPRKSKRELIKEQLSPTKMKTRSGTKSEEDSLSSANAQADIDNHMNAVHAEITEPVTEVKVEMEKIFKNMKKIEVDMSNKVGKGPHTTLA